MSVALHHVGLATTDAGLEAEHWRQALGYQILGQLVHDPVQRVKVLFISTGQPGDVPIELVEPDGDDSLVGGFVRRGGGLYHLCYEVNYLEGALARGRANGSIVVQTAVPAAAFGGRRVAWCYTRDRRLVEFLEQTRGATDHE